MTFFQEFIHTVHLFVVNGRWDELNEYFRLIRFLNAPQAIIEAQQPQDK